MVMVKRPRRSFNLRLSLADVVLKGQRLRADETASAATFNLAFAAKRKADRR
jgi:hypothetical protein